MPKTTRKLPAGMAVIGIRLPGAIHQSMKDLREARMRQEGMDPRLSRLYREAVEQYVAAKRQQKLLEEFNDAGSSKTNRAARGGARV